MKILWVHQNFFIKGGANKKISLSSTFCFIGGLICFYEDILLLKDLITESVDWEIIIVSLYCVSTLFIYFIFRYHWNSSVGYKDLAVTFIFITLIVLEKNLIFHIKTMLRIELLAFTLLVLFVLTKIIK